MTTLAIRRLFSGLRARYHVWNGRRAYRAGRLRAAGRHLDLALASGHSSFGAYLLLGKVAYRIRDMRRAMDCFRLARRTDPTRYALEGFPSGFIESLGRKSSTPAPQKYRIVIEPTATDDSRTPDRRPLQDVTKLKSTSSTARTRAANPESLEQADNEDEAGEPSAEAPADALGDFSSRAEQEKARSRPMFRAGEWADIDWDVEARKLFGE
jgi:hypothetical protein